MKIYDWFLEQFSKSKDGTVSLDVACAELSAEVFYKKLAIQVCINLIANTVSRGEFITYKKGEAIEGGNYYLFNVEPNQNKAASKFWRDVIYRLIHDNECLVIQQNDMFYVADSFSSIPFAFKENVYKNVVINGYSLKESYIESEVFHFELHNEKIKNIIEGLYRSYSKLIAASQGHYKKNNVPRGKLKLETKYTQTEKGRQDLDDLMKNRFKRFFEAEGGAVLPLTNGMEYEELASNIGVKGGAEGRDVRAFIDDIFDFVAIGFQIPPTLIKGNVADTDKAFGNFITFCINPLAELITDEINRKLYGKKAFLEKTYVKLDTTRIRAVDIKDIANALDVLLRTGSYSIDDCREQLGKEPLNKDWSRVHWMTKNYERLREGGDKIGDTENQNKAGN